MEMHQLRYAVAVARTGNFSKAAEQCNVSQPSLSQQILKLEEELGERLFERTKRETRPTPHGEAFMKRARRILDEVDAARREAEEAKQLLSGTVTLGAIPTIAPYLLPGAIDTFMRLFPGIEVVIHEETTSGLLGLLQRHQLDFALMSPPLPMDRLETVPVLVEELLLALPPRHPLGNKMRITIGDLAAERLIVLQEGHCLGDQILGFCTRGDLQPCVCFRSAQLETIRSMVTAGVGISLVPAMATDSGAEKEPLYRSFSGKKPRRSVLAAWPARRPPGRAGTELLKILKSHSAHARTKGYPSRRPGQEA